ncbi:MAG TPA: helix-turn-helix domain-containing protein [Streptosporangiaceae bacterium]|jgi:AcrR family transcriptional regulator
MATDRRTLLIHAAFDLFARRAYDEVTTAEIARRAGVSYGLLAHHFDNKRGIYLATIHAAADRIRAMQDAPRGDTPMARLRDAISSHIRYADDNAAGYLTLMRGGSGSDPEVRAIIDDLRAGAARRILTAIGAADPAPPVLRAAMRGWTGYLDELVLDHLDHDDVPLDHLVELAAAALVTAVRTAVALDPRTGLTPEAVDALTGD